MKRPPFLLNLLVLLLSCAVLTACLGKKQPAGPQRRGTAPYTVRGKTYRPFSSAAGFTETGIASWYGPGFHGKKTASGERFDQNALTAAHKLLPLGTKLRVTNLENGREVVVLVNDRGPFVANRVIDLSRGAASKLGMLGRGTARVRLAALQEAGTPPLLTPDGDLLGLFYVQVASFTNSSKAEEMAISMRSRGHGCRVAHSAEGSQLYVQIGPYFSRSEAEKASKALRSSHSGLFVVAE